jgi:hypothetical protein
VEKSSPPPPPTTSPPLGFSVTTGRSPRASPSPGMFASAQADFLGVPRPTIVHTDSAASKASKTTVYTDASEGWNRSAATTPMREVVQIPGDSPDETPAPEQVADDHEFSVSRLTSNPRSVADPSRACSSGLLKIALCPSHQARSLGELLPAWGTLFRMSRSVLGWARSLQLYAEVPSSLTAR